jgi:hypothetical protein
VSTATAPEVTGALVQQPEPTVLFISKREWLRLVKTGRYPMIIPTTGERIGMTAGVTVSFAPDGEFRCPLEGDVTVMDPGGAGEATLPAKELLDWLQRHPRCGDPNEGFYRVDPKAPPLSKAETERLVALATAGDTESLREVIEQERAGWDRQELIEIAQGAVDRLVAMEDRIRAEQREAAESEQVQVDERVRAAEERAAAAEKALAAASKSK